MNGWLFEDESEKQFFLGVKDAKKQYWDHAGQELQNFFIDSEGKKVKFAQLNKVIDESVTKVFAGKTHRGKDLTIFIERPIPDEF